MASAACQGGLGRVGEGGGEEAVGPVFGVAAGVGEDDRGAGVADLVAGELVGEPVTVDVLELERGAVAGLDDDRGEREPASCCSWKSRLPSESVEARFSRLLRSTAASSRSSGVWMA